MNSNIQCVSCPLKFSLYTQIPVGITLKKIQCNHHGLQKIQISKSYQIISIICAGIISSLSIYDLIWVFIESQWKNILHLMQYFIIMIFEMSTSILILNFNIRSKFRVFIDGDLKLPGYKDEIKSSRLFWKRITRTSNAGLFIYLIILTWYIVSMSAIHPIVSNWSYHKFFVGIFSFYSDLSVAFLFLIQTKIYEENIKSIYSYIKLECPERVNKILTESPWGKLTLLYINVVKKIKIFNSFINPAFPVHLFFTVFAGIVNLYVLLECVYNNYELDPMFKCLQHRLMFELVILAYVVKQLENLKIMVSYYLERLI